MKMAKFRKVSSNPNFMLARTAAFKAPSDQKIKIGSILLFKNKVISFGFNNMEKTHPKSQTPYHYIHAEFSVILGVDYRWIQDSIIYLYRETKSGNLGLCKPCRYCETMLREVGVSKVYYTNPKDKSGYSILSL